MSCFKAHCIKGANRTSSCGDALPVLCFTDNILFRNAGYVGRKIKEKINEPTLDVVFFDYLKRHHDYFQSYQDIKLSLLLWKGKMLPKSKKNGTSVIRHFMSPFFESIG